jgi:hypothetical protein
MICQLLRLPTFFANGVGMFHEAAAWLSKLGS